MRFQVFRRRVMRPNATPRAGVFVRQAARCLLALLALSTLPAHAWWDDAWTLRKQIVLDTSGAGANVGEGATSVPVLLRLHAGNFSRFADLKPDGSDLRFIGADDKTPLPFHVERLDIQQELALVWVLVPQVAGNSDQNAIYMYFGNPEAEAAANSGATYGEDQMLVWHFDDAQGAVRDATRNRNHATAGAVRPFAAGLVGYAGAFDGSVRVSAPSAPSLTIAPDRGATLSLWLNLEQAQEDAVLVDLRDATGAALTLAIAGQVPYVTHLAGADAPPLVLRNDATNVVPKAWTHLAVSVGGGKLSLRVNGAEVATAPLTLPAPLAGNLVVGGLADGTRALRGAQVDELRMVRGVTTPAALSLALASEGVGGALLRYGVDGGKDDQAQEPSYFLITMQNVTLDGWIVIVLCAVLFVLSIVVMATKTLTIGAIRRENEAFLTAFRAADARGPAAGGSPDGMRALAASSAKGAAEYPASSLFKLYELGLSETERRTVGEPSGIVLSEQTMQAIRAALHAANIRSSQKLNSGMVLLTLAISGGPFLGLLGTVLGVMITFAAIAHTGEVDVAAIAPGTAAALAATVAGLAVAIPALFGYNYLTIRIREITAENDVFLDEFVTRVAEQYS